MRLFGRSSQDGMVTCPGKELEDVTFRLGLLVEFGRIVVSSESSRVVELLLSSASIASGISEVSVSLIERGSLKLRSYIGNIDETLFYEHFQKTPIWECFQTGRAIYGEADPHLEVCAVFPLTFKDQIFGVLALHAPLINLSDRDTEYIQAFVDFATIALKNNWEFKKLESKAEFFMKQATHDPLTGLYNRQTLADIFKITLAQSQRMDFKVSLLMFDIDKFKNVNDTYGHPFGDIVIRDIAQIALKIVRANDSVFRYGGEEFIILLSGAELNESVKIAQRLRIGVERHTFTDGKTNLKVTISCGAAQWDGKESGERLIKRADQALYSAKEAGRNQVKPAK